MGAAVAWEARTEMMRAKNRLALLAVLLAALPPLAAGQHRPIPPSAEARIVRQVRHEILKLPYFEVFDYITFKVKGYNVTLLGQVTRAVLKEQAEDAVRKVEGVEKVDNRIEVLPLSGFDDELRIRVYRAIYGYPSLSRYALPPVKPIRILVKGGHVTLEGVVDSAADRDVAGIRAQGVPDVFSVKNHLLVDRPAQRKK
jgi:hyperosmotically inducible protein